MREIERVSKGQGLARELKRDNERLPAELENSARLRLSPRRILMRAEQVRWDKEMLGLTESDDNNPVTQDLANLRWRN